MLEILGAMIEEVIEGDGDRVVLDCGEEPAFDLLKRSGLVMRAGARARDVPARAGVFGVPTGLSGCSAYKSAGQPGPRSRQKSRGGDSGTKLLASSPANFDFGCDMTKDTRF
jgi:hypothetical protein